MVAHQQIIMFLLYIFVLPVDLIDPEIALVNDCPKIEQDVIQASKRLGCGNDIYGNNQYLCLPNKNKTSLIEFCFQGFMGIVEKGNCLEFSEGELIQYSCNQFLYGCPEKHFYDYDIYKYPACQNISTELQCYVMDPHCIAQLNTEKSSGPTDVIYAVSILGSLIVFVICCITIILCYKRKRHSRNKSEYCDEKVTDESHTPLTENKDEITVNIEQEIPLSEKKEENINTELETPLSGKRDKKKITDKIESPVSGNIDESKVNFEQEIPLFGIDNEIRIVLIGKTGSGKSATGNSILGINHFNTSVSASCINSYYLRKSADRFGRNILIVDTPGIFDTTQSYKNIEQEISKCIALTCPGPHAFILVFKIARFTEEELKTVQRYELYFGENIFKYLIVLFTRKDDLDEEGKTLFDYIKTGSPILKLLIRKCEGRVIAFNNRLSGDERDKQVRELLSMILNNIEKNNGECYRNEMHNEAVKLLKKREAEIRKKALMEREKEFQRVKNQFTEELSKEVEKHKKEIELIKREEAFIKQEKEKQAMMEQLRKDSVKVVCEEGVEENTPIVSNLWAFADSVLPEIFKKYH